MGLISNVTTVYSVSKAFRMGSTHKLKGRGVPCLVAGQLFSS